MLSPPPERAPSHSPATCSTQSSMLSHVHLTTCRATHAPNASTHSLSLSPSASYPSPPPSPPPAQPKPLPEAVVMKTILPNRILPISNNPSSFLTAISAAATKAPSCVPCPGSTPSPRQPSLPCALSISRSRASQRSRLLLPSSWPRGVPAAVGAEAVPSTPSTEEVGCRVLHTARGSLRLAANTPPAHCAAPSVSCTTYSAHCNFALSAAHSTTLSVPGALPSAHLPCVAAHSPAPSVRYIWAPNNCTAPLLATPCLEPNPRAVRSPLTSSTA